MLSILFVCHGNICRSPMAEFLFRHMLGQRGLLDKVKISSAGTSAEELGNPPHLRTVKVLFAQGIIVSEKQARKVTKEDYSQYDYIYGMDQYNVRDMIRIFGGDPENKVCRLLDLTDKPRDVEDPWYTDDYDKAFIDIKEGCMALLDKVIRQLIRGKQ